MDIIYLYMIIYVVTEYAYVKKTISILKKLIYL